MPYSSQDKIQHYAKVDPLILLGGIVLTFIAGFVNTISLRYFHIPVSHMSGVVTKISIDAGSRDFSDFLNLIFIFSGFFIGAIVSGFVIGAKNIKPSIEYCYILFAEALSLIIAFILFQNGINFGLSMVAFTCGLQNAMASNYLGLIIRTTHVTGIVTDLGALIGQGLKHKTIKYWKILFLGSLLGGFFFGGFCALIAFTRFSFYALWIPASLCLITAVAFLLLRVKKNPHLLSY